MKCRRLQLPPPPAVTAPGFREDHRRRPTGALLDLRAALGTAHLRLHFPALAVGADEHVAAGEPGAPVPPVLLNSHLDSLKQVSES